MPLFDSVMQEKPAVVFEIGSAYTKLGFAAEAHPRFILPTEVLDPNTGKATNLFSFHGTELYDKVVTFLNELFFKYVLVSPKDRRIVVVESVLCPTEFRECLAKAFFKHFEVSLVFFVPTHLVILTTLAVSTALVIDLGFKEAVVLPVYSGVQVLHAWQAQPLASEAIHSEIRRQLLASGVTESLLTEDLIENVKVRTCFVTKFDRAMKYREGKPPTPCPDVEYPAGGKEVIKVSGELRETAFEVLFPEDNDHLGLPYLILEAILKCPLDMRRQLSENIVLIGGTAMIPGLTARLQEELKHLLDSDLYKGKLFLQSFKFHTPPAKANFTAWLGGSIYGGTDLLISRSLTKEAYSKNPRVPDWTHLDDKRSHGSN
ncbi:actin-related protein 10 [Phlebotomus argentipes]|uniref:actin-related protein 10 n=1 Tax=Phlebotomus argentipes TaxID=94469 RepID=UPI0028930F6C|nr:actin-related protein 10 [Phlebotomus argentipes]